MYNKNTDEPNLGIGLQEGFFYQSFPRFMYALKKGIKCSFCQTKLREKDIAMYEHSDGIHIDKYGLKPKQWVYVTCSNKKCQYQWSWIKILRRFYKN